MRLIVTGKSRSGKSSALHRITQTALQGTWSHVLLADGKSIELHRYANASRPVYGEDECAQFRQVLDTTAERLTNRYKSLRTRGLQQAESTDPRELIIIDEIQEFTRNAEHGTAIRKALTRIFEKSGALGDMVIIATQRSTNAIPPSVRMNANTELRMLGAGYYQCVADGHPTRQGCVERRAPLVGADQLTPAQLPDVLGGTAIERTPTPITRYEGVSGSGRTYALRHHPQQEGHRRIYLDIQISTHKNLLIDCLHKCGATAPDGATIAELADAAALALSATPTLLLLDNVEYASEREIGSIHQLLDVATEAALGITPPRSSDHTRDRLASLRRRAVLVELKPLDREVGVTLVRQIAPEIDPASEQTILQRASGHPATIEAYAERVAAHGDEERHKLESYRSPARWLVIGVMFLLFIGLVYAQRHLVQNDIVAAVGTGSIAMTLWLLRPRFMRLTRPK